MEEWISNLENRMVKIIQSDQQKGKKKNEDSLRELCNNIKHSNIYFIEVSKGKESEMGTETLFEEIMAENLINLINKTDIQD